MSQNAIANLKTRYSKPRLNLRVTSFLALTTASRNPLHRRIIFARDADRERFREGFFKHHGPTNLPAFPFERNDVSAVICLKKRLGKACRR